MINWPNIISIWVTFREHTSLAPYEAKINCKLNRYVAFLKIKFVIGRTGLLDILSGFHFVGISHVVDEGIVRSSYAEEEKAPQCVPRWLYYESCEWWV